ncbi:heavy-metal-associated domain-containing protein [Shinella curvata]|uniref:Heavy-metal-associated domain-containing protein n=1 Tax=Shinella curvata TaxID=1817964 RepID=A0ABT8XAW6_9HYPH|nr:heavy-metal-associated domain-containing protein [Shinella curvata]MCJ8054846.1 heavy-metal-associated domain-containing protein [Shinella curvata]MDO6120758.1 heavy-metal-associated domain-containing protein [Shinella curvata]
MSTTLSFTVSDMTCGHCAKTITGAVLGAYPAAKVEIDLSAKRVSIDNAGDRAAVASVIEAEGYTPVAVD